MKYLWALAWTVCLWALLTGAAPLPPVPEASGLVVDQVGALHEGERVALEGRLRGIQESGRAQIAVLIATGSAGETLAEYGLRVAEAWQLGRTGKDDGLLILLVPSAHAARIEVGYGLEGVIPDALASRWIREVLLPGLKSSGAAAGLAQLLDGIEGVLPKAVPKNDENYLFPDHPEWRLPFVLAVFSPFALFPMFFMRWGSLASAPLLVCFLGGAAWSLWGPAPATWAIAVTAFLLPLMWGLNWFPDQSLSSWLRGAKALGNLCAVLLFFSVISLFVGAPLSQVSPEQAWAAPFFAGILALGLAAFLFPSKTKMLMLVLRSYMHFAFILIIVYLALMGFMPRPERIAVPIAATFTALVALALYVDSRKEAGAKRWSHVLIGLALLIVAPFGLFLLYQAALGEASQTRLTEATAGGGSIVGVLWWALRSGFFAAVKIGLGGRFGGGGASGSD